jgi:hypothetical protein
MNFADIIFVGASVAFFVLTAGYASLCETFR